MPHPVTGSRVILTIAHLDHTPENCADDNLRAWCQRCHFAYDLPMHIANRKATRWARSGKRIDRLIKPKRVPENNGKMQSRNQPELKTCPHCGNTRATLMPRLGDYNEYSCPNLKCGTYRIPGTMEQLIENGADPTAGQFVQQRGHKFLVV